MKILVADDCPGRYSRLEACLDSMGIADSSLTFTCCTNQARDKLSTTVYDLLILDVLLPNRPTQPGETAEHSMDLLRDLIETDDLKRPKHIIGITGDPEAYEAHAEHFTHHTWTIVHFEPSSDEWVNTIANCVDYISKQNGLADSVPLEYGVDLVVVCALEKPELSAVLKLDWKWDPPRPLNNMVFVHEGQFECAGQIYTVAAASADRMGMVEAALLSATLLEKLRPRCLAMTGICAGIESRVNLGDILLADPVWDYQCGKQVGSSKDGADHQSSFQMEPHQIQADQEVRALAKQALTADALLSIYGNYERDHKQSRPKLHVGPVATGSAVLADGNMVDSIMKQNRKLLGIEMEIYGVYAASLKAELKPRVFALKSVCDFANEEKGDDLQHYASYISAQALGVIMETFGNKILSN